MVSKTLNGVVYTCPRPSYRLSKFQAVLTSLAFAEFDKLINSETATFVDAEGLVWFPEANNPCLLLDKFILNTHDYFRLQANRHVAFNNISTLVSAAYARLINDKVSPYDLLRCLTELRAAYISGLRYTATANLLVEDVVERFLMICSSVVSENVARDYLNSILNIPIVDRAIELKFFEDTRDTKRIEDVHSEPVLIFCAQRIFTPSFADSDIHQLFSGKIKLAEFISLRAIAPHIIQSAEEWRYCDYSLRTNLKRCLTLSSICIGSNAFSMSPYEIEQKLFELL